MNTGRPSTIIHWSNVASGQLLIDRDQQRGEFVGREPGQVPPRDVDLIKRQDVFCPWPLPDASRYAPCHGRKQFIAVEMFQVQHVCRMAVVGDVVHERRTSRHE